MQNKVVVHLVDGKILKGTTADFCPNEEVFHLQVREQRGNLKIRVATLKAVYFVKTFEGRPEYNEKTNVERSGCGRKVTIYFKDGETQFSYTQGYAANRPGCSFFLPAPIATTTGSTS
jgi:hypothetical protein